MTRKNYQGKTLIGKKQDHLSELLRKRTHHVEV